LLNRFSNDEPLDDNGLGLADSMDLEKAKARAKSVRRLSGVRRGLGWSSGAYSVESLFLGSGVPCFDQGERPSVSLE
jgi:hypothetical protein